jgi:hypothetical protein
MVVVCYRSLRQNQPRLSLVKGSHIHLPYDAVAVRARKINYGTDNGSVSLRRGQYTCRRLASLVPPRTLFLWSEGN